MKRRAFISLLASAAAWPGLVAVRDATRTIPIVFVLVQDPIGQGCVSSLSHPGANVTGFAMFEPAMSGKLVQFLHDIAPGVTRVAFLWSPGWRTSPSIRTNLVFGSDTVAYHEAGHHARIPSAARLDLAKTWQRRSRVVA